MYKLRYIGDPLWQQRIKQSVDNITVARRWFIGIYRRLRHGIFLVVLNNRLDRCLRIIRSASRGDLIFWKRYVGYRRHFHDKSQYPAPCIIRAYFLLPYFTSRLFVKFASASTRYWLPATHYSSNGNKECAGYLHEAALAKVSCQESDFQRLSKRLTWYKHMTTFMLYLNLTIPTGSYLSHRSRSSLQQLSLKLLMFDKSGKTLLPLNKPLHYYPTIASALPDYLWFIG